jgi:hypothetical protein
MSTQQTAIDEFIEQLEQKGGAWENANINRIQISIDVNEYLELKRQAKEIEKERIREAMCMQVKKYTSAYLDEDGNPQLSYDIDDSFNAFYNETYGGANGK